MAESRAPRRRRSVSRTPALVDPADLPEDAAGRIALIVVRAPDDITDPAALAPPPPPPPPPRPVSRAQAAFEGLEPPPDGEIDLPPLRAGLTYWLATAQKGWAGVVVVAVLLLVLFIVGMVLTR